MVQIAPDGHAIQVMSALAGKYAVTTDAFNRWVKFDLNFPPVPTN